MEEYHKVQTVFKRDANSKFKNLIEGEFTLPEFEFLKDNQWVFTEKVDGTNIRIGYENNKIFFGGRTDSSQIPSTLVNQLNKIFLPKIEIFHQMFGDANVCLYGEGYGAKIQKNGEKYRQDQNFVLFDVMIDGWWLQRKNIEDIATKINIDVVPICGQGTLMEMIEQVKKGITSKWGDFQAEGYVAKPKTELKTRGGKRIITKIKCRDFK